LESCFHKRQVSFLVVKTVKCKRGQCPINVSSLKAGKGFLFSVFGNLCRREFGIFWWSFWC